MARTLERIALAVIQSSVKFHPESLMVGNVTALELVKLAAHHVLTCPKCDAEAFVNIDCDLCVAISAAQEESEVERV